jgi:PIN domain nuclease of toxin-antitoxin system
LLDTHILLWWLTQSEQLTKRARSTIAGADAVFVSAASAWEMAIKASIGKLKTPDDLETQMRANRFVELPVKISHSILAADLARHHGDPFDRMLVAQAAAESLTLLTADARLKAYGGSIFLA